MCKISNRISSEDASVLGCDAVLFGVSKDINAFIFRIKQSKFNLVLRLLDVPMKQANDAASCYKRLESSAKSL